MTTRATIAGDRRELTGTHALAIFAAFFGVVFAVNGFMAYAALSTFSGSDGDDAYRRGLTYNATVADALSQDQLGWTSRVEQLPGVLKVTVTDRKGQPVEHLTVSGSLGRPSTNHWDRSVQFHESGAGVYLAPLANAAAGNWIVDLTAKSQVASGHTDVFRLKERLWRKPME